MLCMSMPHLLDSSVGHAVGMPQEESDAIAGLLGAVMVPHNFSHLSRARPVVIIPPASPPVLLLHEL